MEASAATKEKAQAATWGLSNATDCFIDENNIEVKKIKWSTFKSTKDVAGQEQTGTWADFLDSIRQPKITTTKDTALISAASFNGTRKLANVVDVHFLVLDLDNLPDDTTPESILEKIPGIAAVLHTSFNHLQPAKGARFRLLVEVDKPIPKELFGPVIKHFGKRFEGVDAACFDASRMMFVPSVHPDRQHLFQFLEQGGEPYTWQPLTDFESKASSSGPAKNLFDGLSNIPQQTAADLDLIIAGCAQMARAVSVGGPIGYSMRGSALSIMKACHNPRYEALEANDPAPETVAAQNAAMLAQSITATPHVCGTFERHRSKGCEGCQHKGIKSPVSLGYANKRLPAVSAFALPEGELDLMQDLIAPPAPDAPPIEATKIDRVLEANGISGIATLDEVNLSIFEAQGATAGDVATMLEEANRCGQVGDITAGRIFARLAKGKLLFVRPSGKYLCWNNVNWQICEQGEEMLLAKRVADLILKVCTNLYVLDNNGYRAMYKFAQSLQNQNRLEAMIAMSQSEPGASIGHMEQLDSDTMLLGVRNGVVDLKTGALLTPDPKMLITKQAGAAYDHQASCPQWLKFLGEVFEDDQETINYLQRALGYTLTGDVREEVIFLCYGWGSNGKSVLSNTVHSVLGDYAQAAPPSLLVTQSASNAGARNDVARTVGARYLSVNELRDGDTLDEQIVKQLASTEVISARFLHREFFDFQPTGKAWIRTNHRPRITGDDDGIWRRIVPIPFRRQFTGAAKNPKLQEVLLSERDGILAWMVEGCLEWQRKGLAPSNLIKTEQAAYRKESDTLDLFLQDKTNNNQGERVEQSRLYGIYKDWSLTDGLKPFSKKRFTQKLSERGFNTNIRSGNNKYYGGLQLLH